MVRIFALLLSLSADPSTTCDVAALRRADADVALSQRLVATTKNAAQKKVAADLLAKAKESQRTVLALCKSAAAGNDNPFEADDTSDVDGESAIMYQQVLSYTAGTLPTIYP